MWLALLGETINAESFAQVLYQKYCSFKTIIW